MRQQPLDTNVDVVDALAAMRDGDAIERQALALGLATTAAYWRRRARNNSILLAISAAIASTAVAALIAEHVL